ncbi:MAG: hypothetical protein ACKO7B_20720, partial [Flavobacteriales bacterium]
MKKPFLFIIAILSVVVAKSQTINNNSFEQWTNYSGTTQVGFPFTGQNPDGWSTSDSLTQTYSGGSSVYPGTDSQDGIKSVHLKSSQITVILSGVPFQITVPGSATNGTLT